MTGMRRGFVLYLAFVVTTVLFFLVMASYSLAMFSLDNARSVRFDAVMFHAADGGLERGVALLRRHYSPFTLKYAFDPGMNSRGEIELTAEKNGSGTIDLSAFACIFEGSRKVAEKHLKRSSISDLQGRTGLGSFAEGI